MKRLFVLVAVALFTSVSSYSQERQHASRVLQLTNGTPLFAEMRVGGEKPLARLAPWQEADILDPHGELARLGIQGIPILTVLSRDPEGKEYVGAFSRGVPAPELWNGSSIFVVEEAGIMTPDGPYPNRTERPVYLESKRKRIELPKGWWDKKVQGLHIFNAGREVIVAVFWASRRRLNAPQYIGGINFLERHEGRGIAAGISFQIPIEHLEDLFPSVRYGDRTVTVTVIFWDAKSVSMPFTLPPTSSNYSMLFVTGVWQAVGIPRVSPVPQ